MSPGRGRRVEGLRDPDRPKRKMSHDGKLSKSPHYKVLLRVEPAVLQLCSVVRDLVKQQWKALKNERDRQAVEEAWVVYEERWQALLDGSRLKSGRPLSFASIPWPVVGALPDGPSGLTLERMSVFMSGGEMVDPAIVKQRVKDMVSVVSLSTRQIKAKNILFFHSCYGITPTDSKEGLCDT